MGHRYIRERTTWTGVKDVTAMKQSERTRGLDETKKAKTKREREKKGGSGQRGNAILKTRAEVMRLHRPDPSAPSYRGRGKDRRDTTLTAARSPTRPAHAHGQYISRCRADRHLTCAGGRPESTDRSAERISERRTSLHSRAPRACPSPHCASLDSSRGVPRRSSGRRATCWRAICTGDVQRVEGHQLPCPFTSYTRQEHHHPHRGTCACPSYWMAWPVQHGTSCGADEADPPRRRCYRLLKGGWLGFGTMNDNKTAVQLFAVDHNEMGMGS